MKPKYAGRFFFSVVLFYILTGFAAAGLIRFLPEVGFAWSAVLGAAIIGLPLLVFVLCTMVPVRAQLGLRRVRPATCLLSLLLMVVVYPLVTLVNALTMLFTDNVVETISGDILEEPLWLMLLLVGVLGPLVEELAFRGYIYRNLRESGRVRSAILLSAVLFGLMHMNFNQACYAALLGVFLAAADEAADSLWPSVLMHMGFNSLEVLILYGAEQFADDLTEEALEENLQSLSPLPDTTEWAQQFWAALFCVSVCAVCVALAVLILRRIARLEKTRGVGAGPGGVQTQGRLTGGGTWEPAAAACSAASPGGTAQAPAWQNPPEEAGAARAAAQPKQPDKNRSGKTSLLSVSMIAGMVITAVYILLDVVFA